jgi:ankyrin repeat protein
MTTIEKEKIIFDLIKNHKYDKLINIIKSDNTIDLNIIDETGTYLIQYAIIFRQKDLIALLISKNCKLDILDSDGRNIYYIPIKFGYDEIVKLLINFSNIVIGIPLLEVQDINKNIALHYAIMFNKYDIIEEIINNSQNINFKDKNGDTALHMIIKILIPEKIYLIELLIAKKLSINYVNNLGQNCLHIAIEANKYNICKILLDNKININIETINEHITPILLATKNNNYEICELLLKYDLNMNCQDIYGNSILNYAILNKSKRLIEKYYDKVDVNLINISGKISIDLFFENNYELSKLDDYKFREILIKSKMNIQNNEGRTIWHNLVEYDIWEQYIDILINKKNKIFIQDINNISPYNIIQNKFKNKLEKFIDMISISFYNYIKENPDLNYNFNIKDKLNINNREECINIIKKLIINQHISFPDTKKIYCVENLILNDVKFSSYIGIQLDIISGLIYIGKKFNKIQTTLTSNFIKNPMLEDYYMNNGIQKPEFDDFLNYEIIWSYHKLFIPTNLKLIIFNFLKDNTKEYLIIPIGIELSNGAHANILLYIKETNELERYEPYGKDFPSGFNYNPNSLDHNLKNLFINYFENEKKPFKYISPSEYEIKIGLQFLDTIESSKEKNIGDAGGFCGAWSLWYIEMRISNINIKRDDLLNSLVNYIRMKKVSFRSTIRNFTKNITDIRDKILSVANIDINKWINNNYTKEEYEQIVNQIIKEI